MFVESTYIQENIDVKPVGCKKLQIHAESIMMIRLCSLIYGKFIYCEGNGERIHVCYHKGRYIAAVISSAVPSGSGAFQMLTCPSSGLVIRNKIRVIVGSVKFKEGYRANLRNASVTFLAPPAERQWSFSNAELSVIRLSVCPSVKIEVGGGGGG